MAAGLSIGRQVCAPISKIFLPATPRKLVAKNSVAFAVAESIFSPGRTKLSSAGSIGPNPLFASSPKQPPTPGTGRLIFSDAVTSALSVYSLASTISTVEKTLQSEFQKALKRLGSNLGRNWRNVLGQNDWEGMLDPMDHNLRHELLRYGEFAQVCYDAFDNDKYSKYYGTCKYPKADLLNRVDLQSTGYEVTKYLYATAGSMPQVMGRGASDKDSNWMGFVAVATSESEIKRLGRRDIVVSWRGTVLPVEWMQNLKDFLEPARFEPSDISSLGVKVESGFLNMYTSSNPSSLHSKRSARDQLLDEIKRLVHLYKDDQLSITFTGHSLGGALALLSAYDVAELGLNTSPSGSKIPTTVFSFGAPRVGNDQFCDRCEDLQVKTMRVVNVKDMVPKVPGVIFNEGFQFLRHLVQGLPWTYSHVGVELQLNSDESPFLRRTNDPCAHHNLEAYLHLLDGYHGPDTVFCSSTGRDPALVNKASDFLKKELGIPSNWWQEQHRGLVQNHLGRWLQPDRETDDWAADFGELSPQVLSPGSRQIQFALSC